MSKDSFKFGPVEPLQKPFRYGDNRVFGIPAGREGVGRHFIYNIDFRQRQAGGDAKIFNNPVKLGVVFEFNRPGVRHREHQFVRIPITQNVRHHGKNHSEIQNAGIAVYLRESPGNEDNECQKPSHQKPGFLDVFVFVRV